MAAEGFVELVAVDTAATVYVDLVKEERGNVRLIPGRVRVRGRRGG